MKDIYLIISQKKSLSIGQRRIDLSSVVNVRVVLDRIENYGNLFHLGESLHACGGATDVCLQKLKYLSIVRDLCDDYSTGAWMRELLASCALAVLGR
jgi:hypothetical protein